MSTIIDLHRNPNLPQKRKGDTRHHHLHLSYSWSNELSMSALYSSMHLCKWWLCQPLHLWVEWVTYIRSLIIIEHVTKYSVKSISHLSHLQLWTTVIFKNRYNSICITIHWNSMVHASFRYPRWLKLTGPLHKVLLLLLWQDKVMSYSVVKTFWARLGFAMISCTLQYIPADVYAHGEKDYHRARIQHPFSPKPADSCWHLFQLRFRD